MCFERLDDSAKAAPQPGSGQTKGFEPVWMRLWIVKAEARAKERSQPG